jgi:hypothetical protein
MRASESIAKCPNDARPMVPFARRKAGQGWTIALLGCAYCNHDHVIAVASDESGNSRFVGWWHRDPVSGEYILTREDENNPPGWLELTCSALPQRRSSNPNEPREQT